MSRPNGRHGSSSADSWRSEDTVRGFEEVDNASPARLQPAQRPRYVSQGSSNSIVCGLARWILLAESRAQHLSSLVLRFSKNLVSNDARLQTLTVLSSTLGRTRCIDRTVQYQANESWLSSSLSTERSSSPQRQLDHAQASISLLQDSTVPGLCELFGAFA